MFSHKIDTIEVKPASFVLDIIVPEFSQLPTSVWFVIFEYELSKRSITDDHTRYNQLVPRLPVNIILLVQHIILSPPTTGRYETLKAAVLSASKSANASNFVSEHSDRTYALSENQSELAALARIVPQDSSIASIPTSPDSSLPNFSYEISPPDVHTDQRDAQITLLRDELARLRLLELLVSNYKSASLDATNKPFISGHSRPYRSCASSTITRCPKIRQPNHSIC